MTPKPFNVRLEALSCPNHSQHSLWPDAESDEANPFSDFGTIACSADVRPEGVISVRCIRYVGFREDGLNVAPSPSPDMHVLRFIVVSDDAQKRVVQIDPHVFSFLLAI